MISTCLTHVTVLGQSMSRNTVDIGTMLQVHVALKLLAGSHTSVSYLYSHPVKGVNFFGLQSEYIVSGSDCGHVFLWDKNSEQIVQCLEGDEEGVVSCVCRHSVCWYTCNTAAAGQLS